MPIVGRERAFFDLLPAQDHDSGLPGLTGCRLVRRHELIGPVGVLGFRHERGRIDQDSSNPTVPRIGHVQEQQARLRRDRQLNLVTPCQSTARLEGYLFEEELHDVIEALLVG